MSDIQDSLGDLFDGVGDSIQGALGRFEINLLLKNLWFINYEALEQFSNQRQTQQEIFSVVLTTLHVTLQEALLNQQNRKQFIANNLSLTI